jgi:hypothetical protein
MHKLDSDGRDKGRDECREGGGDMRETGISWVKSGDFSLEDMFERSTSSQVPQGLGPLSLNLRDAMAALRHAVQHPLSNQQEVIIWTRMNLSVAGYGVVCCVLYV